MTLSVKQKLWIPTGIMAAILVVGGGLAVSFTRAALESSGKAMAAQQEKLQLAQQWWGYTQANSARTVAVMRSSEPSLEASLKAEMSKTSAIIGDLSKQIEALSQDEDSKAGLAAVNGRRSAYMALRADANKLKAQDPAAALAMLDGKVVPALTEYLVAQDAFVKSQRARLTAMNASVASDHMTFLFGTLGLLVVVMGAMVAVTVAVVRQVSGPLGQLAQSARRIAEGDLTEKIQAERQDEIGEVVIALSEMQSSLRKSVSIVRQTADSIQVASSEVASGNQDLSSRTEQTAGSLQQTASSMEHLTGTVRDTAHSAQTANDLASSAAVAAQRGGDVVSQVVHNMEEITASSRKIADIINVIDGIAFQTNILALNAAVEAARAGEQGRGFAVVAGEVRNLAQRSANAAKEIKSLIGASAEKVADGSKLVREAGGTMEEIVSSVQRVSDIISQITASASEQSSELGQVNTAVTQLDQMTQQNAALVEESAAAAESLRDQASRLMDAVSVFRVGEEAQWAGRASVSAPVPAFTSAPGVSTSRPAPSAFAAPKPAPAPAPMPAPSPAPAARSSSGPIISPVNSPGTVRAAATSDEDWETF